MSTHPDSVLLAYPGPWDRRHVERPRGAESPARFHLDPVDDLSWYLEMDIDSEVDRLVQRARTLGAGVAATSDFPGAIMAAIVARRLGTPGPPPDAVIRASHKVASREVQARVAPEATPRFAAIDPRAPTPPPFGFPCFVKPVKGWFSIMARRIDDRDAFEAYTRDPALDAHLEAYAPLFDRLRRRTSDLVHEAHAVIAEEVACGALVTIEGFVTTSDAVEVIGIVDAEVDPRTGSFLAFHLPSALPAPVQARMAAIACRVIAALGLEHTLWNIEMMYDAARDTLAIIEVNPRMAGQFADLHEKVDGLNTYDLAWALATGRAPRGPHAPGVVPHAASIPLRLFSPARVAAAPDAAAIARAEALHPGTLVWNEVRTGEVLARFAEHEDGHSVRYGVVNLGGDSRAQIGARLGEITRALGYRFAPLENGIV